MKKIAALAEVHYVAMAPHSAADPVGVAASLQAMAGTPNFLIQEYGGGGGDTLFTTPLAFKDGFVELPRGPGLGIEISGGRPCGKHGRVLAASQHAPRSGRPVLFRYLNGGSAHHAETSTLPAKSTLPAASRPGRFACRTAATTDGKSARRTADSTAGKSARRSGIPFQGIAAVLCAFVALGCASEPDPSASNADPESRGGEVPSAAADSPTSVTADSPNSVTADSPNSAASRSVRSYLTLHGRRRVHAPPMSGSGRGRAWSR